MDVSNPDKVMFPDIGLTKAELVAHHRQVGEEMLRFLARSPLTLERYPDGIASSGFRQKNASSHFPEVIGRVEIPKRGGTTLYPTVESVEGIIYLVNQGTITFHPWTSALPDLERPGFLVLDLDPEEGDLDGVRSVARSTRRVLDRFELPSTPVASGSKGFHIWVTLSGEHDFEAVGIAARALAGLVALEDGRATIEFQRANRDGRVFVDWLRNGRAQTIACPFGVRAKPGAPVATPLPWDAVGDTAPDRWRVRNFGDRPPVEFAGSADLPVDAIIARAKDGGVDLESAFDRFGRAEGGYASGGGR